MQGNNQISFNSGLVLHVKLVIPLKLPPMYHTINTHIYAFILTITYVHQLLSRFTPPTETSCSDTNCNGSSLNYLNYHNHNHSLFIIHIISENFCSVFSKYRDCPNIITQFWLTLAYLSINYIHAVI